MELKKNPKVDVNRLRIVLLEIGLIVALLVVIAAFLYTPREVTVEKIDMNYGPVEEQITEITRQDQKPPASKEDRDYRYHRYPQYRD